MFFPDTPIWRGSTIHPNTAQNWLFVSEDKVRIYLEDYSKAVNTRTAWVAPVTLALTIVGVLLTVSFVDKFGKKASFWEAVFDIAFIATVAWTVVSLFNLVRYWRAASVDHLIDKIKSSQPTEKSYLDRLSEWLVETTR